MDTFLRPKGLRDLDLEIERVVAQLRGMDPVDKEYSKVAETLRTLCEAREKKNDRVITSEAIMAAAVNILGLLIVLNFEKTGIITSKAFSLLRLGKPS